MTDKEKLEQLLTSWGVEYETTKWNSIRCEEGHEKIKGYGCFYTEFRFGDDGEFEEMGAYE